AQDGLALERGGEHRVEGDRLDPDVRIVEAEALKPTQRCGELVLLAAGNLCLDGLEVPALLGDLPLGQPLTARTGERRHKRHIERARAAEPRPGGRLGSRGEGTAALHGKHAQRRLDQVEAPVEDEPARVGALELLAEVLRHEPDQAAAELQLDVRREFDASVHHDAPFARGERRHVGPAACEVEPRWRRRPELNGQLAPPHGPMRHWVTAGSSPRTSIRTPCTRRSIPCTPRACYRKAMGSESRNRRWAVARSAGARRPARSASWLKYPNPGPPAVPTPAASHPSRRAFTPS